MVPCNKCEMDLLRPIIEIFFCQVDLSHCSVKKAVATEISFQTTPSQVETMSCRMN